MALYLLALAETFVVFLLLFKDFIIVMNNDIPLRVLFMLTSFIVFHSYLCTINHFAIG